MQIALCNEVLRDKPFEEQCAFAAAVGFAGLELAPFTLKDNPEELTAADAHLVRAALQAEGLACCGLHWLLSAPDGLSITSDDRAVRARTIGLMKRLVEFAAEAGAARLVHGSPGQRTLPVGDEEGGRARAREAFAQVADVARQAGVVYCVEPLSTAETEYLTTVEEAAALVEAIGSPGLQTMIDTSAAARDGADPVALIEEFMPRGIIKHIHVNDPNRRGPGEGTLSFGPIIAALRAQGYGGWVSAEPFVYLPDGPACAARAAGVLTTLLREYP
ncbi:MAG: sugar phosphate isomerase/epimerase family protein [Pseudomonadota bacterium]